MSDLTEAREAVLVAADKRSTALLNAIDALLLAYRSALAGETEQETLEKAALAVIARESDGLADSHTLVREDMAVAAPILRAPLLVQLQDKNERIKALRGALTNIREYWNRDRNEEAMHDALWHIIETAGNVLDGRCPECDSSLACGCGEAL